MKNVDELLNNYFSKVKIDEGKAYNNFYDSWVKLVGNKVAENSRVVDVEDGVLIVEIFHPGWKQLIEMKKSYIISKTSKMFPELKIKKISYKFTNKKIFGENSPVEVENTPKEKKEVKIENLEFKKLLEKMNKRSQE